ncbi:Hypothetical predicted protein [Olea europaea subsp. europaea]|uniref:Uncharacterized protein n=1 Tax=Olea europaea subsp. europaea TaxID=158383 RepID=A0A8S0R7H9_OLEEU|nr:Hypothetical predicted protein [Olea europaea subsp. europaea]
MLSHNQAATLQRLEHHATTTTATNIITATANDTTTSHPTIREWDEEGDYKQDAERTKHRANITTITNKTLKTSPPTHLYRQKHHHLAASTNIDQIPNINIHIQKLENELKM